METLKVLIIDDEPGILSGVSRILKNHIVSYPFMDEDFNFNVLEAASGEDGIKIIEKEKPEILLLDNKLPGIQGTDVLKYIDDNNIRIFIAMITSYASIDIAIKATGFGASDFIPKPFTPQELKFAIDNITKQLYLKRITQKMKEEGKQIRYQFLSVLSHELKSPINSIEGYLMMMAEKQSGEKIDDYMEMIERSISRVKAMRALIMDLLDMTKITPYEKKKDKIIKIDLKKIAEMAISTILPYAIQKNVTLKLESCPDVTIMAVADDIEILFNNLLSNAVKYNKINGFVNINLCKIDNQIEIIVKDTGIGFEDGEINKVFGEFVRIKNEKTKNISGSGLGLSIVKNLVDSYHGKIEVESTPDVGSTFKILLPI
jgi:two-component system, sensor histidine kinase and response regulator